MKKYVLICLLCVVSLSWLAPTAKAIAPFKKAFQEKYVNESENEDFKAAFKKASCNVCHIKGEKKDQRNKYAEELSKLIEGDANQRIMDAGKDGADARKAETAKILKELEKAIETVDKMESPDGTPYGKRIAEGKLPVE